MGMRALDNFGKDYTTKFAAIYPRLSKKHAVPLDEFFLEGVAFKPRYNQEDQIHPTATGYGVIVGRLAPRIEAWLRALAGD